jgi:hypothetical protein
VLNGLGLKLEVLDVANIRPDIELCGVDYGGRVYTRKSLLPVGKSVVEGEVAWTGYYLLQCAAQAMPGHGEPLYFIRYTVLILY